MVHKHIIPALIAGMLVTGISNSIFNKYQDMVCVANCDNPDSSRHIEFSQPVWQTATMFLGESLCLLPVIALQLYKRIIAGRTWATLFQKDTSIAYSPLTAQSPNGTPRNSLSGQRPSNMQRHQSMPSIPTTDAVGDEDDFSFKTGSMFFLPALCDVCGTTLMNVGLIFTPVSIYQMTRGALVLWVGIFSVIFLRKSLYMYQWLSLVTVMLGVSIVGLSGTLLSSSESSPSILATTPALAHENKVVNALGSKGDEELPEAIGALLGVVLILFAQIFVASQFVLEEKIMGRYSVEPVLAVGMEGIFGLATTLSAQFALYMLYGRTKDGKGGYFDMPSGWHQIVDTPPLLWSSFAIALSIAFFNFFGLSVTRNISATARSTIDTCRTLGIWVVSLTLGWEVFKPLSGSLQILGFSFLCYGTLVFNSVIRPPRFLRPSRSSLGSRRSSRPRPRRSKSLTSSRRNRRTHSHDPMSQSWSPEAQRNDGMQGSTSSLPPKMASGSNMQTAVQEA